MAEKNSTEANVKAKAVHYIHHGEHEKMVKSGETFSAPKSQIDRLVALGAAELVTNEPAQKQKPETAEEKAARGEAAELAGKSK